MGCGCCSKSASGQTTASEPTTHSVKPAPNRSWTRETADDLQEAIDHIFQKESKELSSFEFSLTLADPKLPDCPLIGCSTGFTKLVQYSMEEIVGRNCRFLIDPVPKNQVNDKVRRQARDFCQAVAKGEDYKLSNEERETWMPLNITAGEIFCSQTNARKNGELFRNMFYMRTIELDDKPYIIALQTELASGNAEEEAEAKRACQVLSANMHRVTKVLSKHFWFTGPMARQEASESCFAVGFGSDTVLPGTVCA
jgi:hypothetical protein